MNFSQPNAPWPCCKQGDLSRFVGAFFVEYSCWRTCHIRPLILSYCDILCFLISIQFIGLFLMRHIFIIYLMKYPSLPLPGTETYLDFNGPRILSYWTTTNVDSWLNFNFQINGDIRVYFTVFLVHVWLTSWKYWISHITSFILYFLSIYSLR